MSKLSHSEGQTCNIYSKTHNLTPNHHICFNMKLPYKNTTLSLAITLILRRIKPMHANHEMISERHDRADLLKAICHSNPIFWNQAGPPTQLSDTILLDNLYNNDKHNNTSITRLLFVCEIFESTLLSYDLILLTSHTIRQLLRRPTDSPRRLIEGCTLH